LNADRKAVFADCTLRSPSSRRMGWRTIEMIAAAHSRATRRSAAWLRAAERSKSVSTAPSMRFSVFL
jgi:hypothetical protein